MQEMGMRYLTPMIDREGKIVKSGYIEYELEELVDGLLMDKETVK